MVRHVSITTIQHQSHVMNDFQVLGNPTGDKHGLSSVRILVPASSKVEYVWKGSWRESKEVFKYTKNNLHVIAGKLGEKTFQNAVSNYLLMLMLFIITWTYFTLMIVIRHVPVDRNHWNKTSFVGTSHVLGKQHEEDMTLTSAAF